MNRRKHVLYFGLVVGLALALVGLLGAGLAHARAAVSGPAATFVVTTLNDSGPGSLRQALQDANASPGADLIRVTATGTLLLASPLPVITDAVTIQGPGADLFKVDGGGLYRVFDIDGAEASLADLTVQGGAAAGLSAEGAGLRSAGNLTLMNVHVLSNTAQGGGGGLYVAGDLVVQGGLFRNNRSNGGNGGGLRSCCVVTISGTQFVSNTASGDGGAVVALGTVTVDHARFEENHCTTGSCDGGAMFAYSHTTIRNTAFRGNTAGDDGGALSAPGNLFLEGSLFQDNQGWNGGALYVQDTASIRDTEFLSNTAQGGGGGLYSFGAVTVTHGLFQNNETFNSAGGGVLASGSAFLSGTRFLDNAAPQGGGLYHTLWDARVINSLFAGNQAASGEGEAMLLASPEEIDVLHVTVAGQPAAGSAVAVLSGTVQVLNTILNGHGVGISVTAGSVYQDYNLFFGNGADVQGVVSGGAHSLVGDPLFADPGVDDYHLIPGSPAIDQGTAAGVWVDFEGDARPWGGGYEIGFDEVPIGPPPPPPPPDPLGVYLPIVFR
jgi:predicted outer membrane repeat protein